MHEKLQILLKKKQEAVELEDYDAAMELKDISDKLKLIGADLKMLEQRKQEAIGGEDFETAKSCKSQIDRLKSIVGNLDPLNPF